MKLQGNGVTSGLNFPGGAKFALAIVDDTDNATVDNVGEVYKFLTSVGVRATKTVWVYPPRDSYGGQCLLDADYLDFIRSLMADGHEIALHNVGSGSFSRDEIIRGLEIFRSLIGSYPRLHTNHVSNPDNLYWHSGARFSPPVGWLYMAIRIVMRWALKRPLTESSGDVEASPHFWGDIAKKNIAYVRNLTFSGVDTFASDPRMPYHDPRKPFVQQWFSSSDGHTVHHFCNLLSNENIDRLAQANGVSIIYTHFTDGFVKEGVLHPGFERCMRRVTQMDGWFAPASEVLDWLGARSGRVKATPHYLRMLELRWLVERVVNYLRYRR